MIIEKGTEKEKAELANPNPKTSILRIFSLKPVRHSPNHDAHGHVLDGSSWNPGMSGLIQPPDFFSPTSVAASAR
jgi:hypothetical protein